MSLVAGSVTVNPDATYTGTGLALAIMTALATTIDARWPPDGTPGTPSKRTMHDGLAESANALATAIVSHITANAVVTVPVSTNELASGVPSSPTNLTGTIT